jgi:hypothetical protein
MYRCDFASRRGDSAKKFRRIGSLAGRSNTGGCAINIGKGLLWSIAWPAGWAVYLKGAL